MSDFRRHVLEDSLRGFRSSKKLADRALAQLTDDELFVSADAEANSVAIIMKHMAGNMRSRWTDFLTTDGEKPDRHRDEEFVIRDDDTAASVRERWEEGWRTVFDAVGSLAPDDCDRTVTIRGETHTVVEAIHRQLGHYAYHVGQIVHVARSLRGDGWQSLSIPRGESQAFNDAMREKSPEGL